MKKILVIVLFCLVCVGCGKGNGLISYLDAKEKIINNNAILLDVRTKEEYDVKHIEGAVLLDVSFISEETMAQISSDKDTEIIVYCQSGTRSSEAKRVLGELGYKKVYDLGSIDNWKE